MPYQPGSLLMATTLPLDQLALPTGQPAHGHNTAAGPTCPTNRAACSWTQHAAGPTCPTNRAACSWTQHAAGPTCPTNRAACSWTQHTAGPTCPTNQAACSWTQHCCWTNLPYQPGSLSWTQHCCWTNLPYQPGSLSWTQHCRWTNLPYQPGSLLMDTTLPLDQLALPTGQPAHGRNTAAGPTCPANRAACSWTQHCRWTNFPYQPGSLLMATTLALDQLALPTGQPAHGRNTAAGPTCPTNRAACSWTQHCRWTNLPYQPGSLLMDATLPLDQLALPTGQPAHGRNTTAGPTCPTNRAACSWTQHCRWTNLPYQPGSLLMDTTLPLDQLALPIGQPASERNTAAGPTCPTNRAACSWTQHCRWTNLPYQPGSLLVDATLPLDQLALLVADQAKWAPDGRSIPRLQESP